MRTAQGRFLLRPSAGMREVFVGILARAQERYDVDLHGFVALSNHFHLLVSPADACQLARFMCYVATNLSKEAGRHHGWHGSLFARRHQAIPISTEAAAQIDRLRYLLSHGVKEGLVARAVDWPGAHCARALLTGETPIGLWFDRTAQFAARHRGEDAPDTDFATAYRLELVPLPCWRHLAAQTVRRYIGDMLRAIEEDAARQHTASGTSPLGVERVLRQDPEERPSRSNWTPAPLFHAASRRVRLELKAAYYEFVVAFRAAAESLKAGCHDIAFPPGAFPPSLPYCRSAPG